MQFQHMIFLYHRIKIQQCPAFFYIQTITNNISQITYHKKYFFFYGRTNHRSAAAAAVSAARPRPPITSMERTVRALDRQISQFVAMGRLIWADSADADAFLEAVDDLIGTV